MSDRSAPLQQPYGRAHEQMLEQVRYDGACPTREKAGKPSASSFRHWDAS
ncbi:hypothetical protein FB157_13519 [Streptomyces sp. BK340]|nr:hypothetical protein FB157_13519 [Streptomyces sp. BK340]